MRSASERICTSVSKVGKPTLPSRYSPPTLPDVGQRRGRDEACRLGESVALDHRARRERRREPVEGDAVHGRSSGRDHPYRGQVPGRDVGVADDRRPHRRTAGHIRRPIPLDEFEHAAGIEPDTMSTSGEDLGGTAHQQEGHVDQRVRVEERRHDDRRRITRLHTAATAVTRLEMQCARGVVDDRMSRAPTDHLGDVCDHVAVQHLHPFGDAGGAAGEGEMRDVVGTDRQGGRFGCRVVGLDLVQGRVLVGRAVDDDREERVVAERLTEHIEVPAGGEHRRRVRVVELCAQARRRLRGVDQCDRCTCTQSTVVGQDELDAVVEVQGDDVSLVDTSTVQARGHCSCPMVQFGVAEHSVAIDDGVPAGVHRRHTCRKSVERDLGVMQLCHRTSNS